MHNILVLTEKEDFDYTVLPQREDLVSYHVRVYHDLMDLPELVRFIQGTVFSGVLIDHVSMDNVGNMLDAVHTIRSMKLGKGTPCDVPIAILANYNIELDNLPINTFKVAHLDFNIQDQLIYMGFISEKTYKTGHLPFVTLSLQDRPNAIALGLKYLGSSYSLWVSKENYDVIRFVGDITADIAGLLSEAMIDYANNDVEE